MNPLEHCELVSMSDTVNSTIRTGEAERQAFMNFFSEVADVLRDRPVLLDKIDRIANAIRFDGEERR